MDVSVSINYREHQKNIVCSLPELFCNATYHDVVFVCSDLKEIPAHRLLLGAMSPFLLKLFNEQAWRDIVHISLPDCDRSDLVNVLRLAYEGVVRLEEGELQEFFNIKSMLGLNFPTEVVNSDSGLPREDLTRCAEPTSPLEDVRTASLKKKPRKLNQPGVINNINQIVTNLSTKNPELSNSNSATPRQPFLVPMKYLPSVLSVIERRKAEKRLEDQIEIYVKRFMLKMKSEKRRKVQQQAQAQQQAQVQQQAQAQQLAQQQAQAQQPAQQQAQVQQQAQAQQLAQQQAQAQQPAQQQAQAQQPVQQQDQQQAQQQPQQQALLDGLLGEQKLQQALAQRGIIWRGTLEWVERKNVKGPQISQAKLLRKLACQVGSNSKDGLELSAEKWPQNLLLQLMPKTLLKTIGDSFLTNHHSKSVYFYPQECEALNTLVPVMKSGCVGVVSFNGNNPACDIKVLILLYTSDRLVGLIPNDQKAFLERLRKVIEPMKQGNRGQGQNQQAMVQLPQ